MSKRTVGHPPTRRDFLRLTAGGAAAAMAGPAGLGQALAVTRNTPGKRPNVLFVFDDQLRADACGLYGGKNITTPNIDRLGAQGVTFNNGTSTCPLCTPYRGMLMTGRYPTHSGIVVNFVNAHPNQPCIAQVFKDVGYDTGFIGKWHLSVGRMKRSGKHGMTEEGLKREKQIERDYQKVNPNTEYVPPGPDRLGFDHWETYNFHMDFGNYWYYKDEPKRIYSGKYETDTQTDQAIAYMKQHQASGTDRPFFLMVAPHPPHPPFEHKHSPAGYVEKIRPDLHWSPNVPPEHRMGGTAKDARFYYAMSKNVDDNLGRLMAYLDESGLADNTIVVFTADHGEMLGSHNRRNKMVPYAEAVDIPMIIRWPGRIPAGRRVDKPHATIDHMTTLCGLAGIDAPDTADGVDMTPMVLGKGNVDRDAILMGNYVSHWNFFDTGTIWPEWRAVRTEQYTYAKWLTGKEELYDNLEDPCQMKELAQGQRHLPILRKLRSRLKDLMADAHDEFLPGTAYADWYDDQRNLLKTALGAVS